MATLTPVAQRRLERPGRWTAGAAIAVLRAAVDDDEVLASERHREIVAWLRRDLTPSLGTDRARTDRLYAAVRAGGKGERAFRSGFDGAGHAGYGALLDGLEPWIVSRFLGLGCPWIGGLPAAGDVVVDLGCGAGADAQIAARAVGDRGAVHAVDLREALFPPMLDRASGVRYRVAAADRTGLPGATASLVIANGLPPLMAPATAPAVATEVRRLLAPRGRFRAVVLEAGCGDADDADALISARRSGKPLRHELVGGLARGGVRVDQVVPLPSPYAEGSDPGPVQAVLLAGGAA